MPELWTTNFLEPNEELTQADYQNFIALSVDAIEGFIRSYLGVNQLIIGPVTDEIKTKNQGLWYLPKNYPIQSVESLTLNDEPIDLSSIEIHYSGIRREAGLNGDIKISYTAGFPEDVLNVFREIIIQYVHFEFQNLKAGRWGETSRTYADGTSTWKTTTEFLTEVQQKLELYRRK